MRSQSSQSFGYAVGQPSFHEGQLMMMKPKTLAQLWRPVRTLQLEHRLSVRANDVNMRWSVVVEVDRTLKPRKRRTVGI